jgi:serine/threonine-protein phosphatase PPG1
MGKKDKKRSVTDIFSGHNFNTTKKKKKNLQENNLEIKIVTVPSVDGYNEEKKSLSGLKNRINEKIIERSNREKEEYIIKKDKFIKNDMKVVYSDIQIDDKFRTDLDECIERMLNGELLSVSTIKFICKKCIEILSEEPNVVPLQSPITLVGDVHGQFYDVLEIFRIGGMPPYTNYLFLGDFVDRGYFSVETITLLTLLKVRYPSRMTLIRGNHESRHTSQSYGFYKECITKYGDFTVWEYFCDMFDYMPLGALIDNDLLGIHGGLSPSLQTIDQINSIYRFQEIPLEGSFTDLVWCDPKEDHKGFQKSGRGAGYTFGKDVVDKFNHTNGLTCIARAHQLCMKGYEILFDKSFITVWSAPNYCYRMQNKASILEITETGEKKFNIFEEAPADERKHVQIGNKLLKQIVN